MSSAVVSPTPSDLINFLKLSQIILEDVPDVLRSLFNQKISERHGKKFLSNAKWGESFFQQEKFTSKLSKHQKQRIESGLTQNWDSTLLFHALLYSSHFLLADSIPGQLSVTNNSNKATTVKVDLRHIKQDDSIILDFGKSCFIAEVTIVGPTEISFKRPLSLPRSSHSLKVNAYLCLKMWCVVQDLSFIRNDEFAHRTSARITEQQLLNVVERIESNYKDLNVPAIRISSFKKILAEPIVESSILQKVEYYREKWKEECKYHERIMECFEKEIPEIKKAQQKMKDQIEQLDERVIALENQALNTEPNSGPMQLDIVNPGVHDLELRIDQVSELQEIANKLQGKYDFLVLGVKKSLEDHPNIEVKDAKMLIKECLKRKAHVVSELMPCINILNKLNDFESFFDFLSKYDFIGYLNYMLLKKLSELVEDDDGINRLFLEYEKEYAKLLSAASFEDLIPFFEKQSDLSPTAPLGLPYVSFHLEKPWLVTSIYTWFSTLGEFSWSYYAFLKQLQKKCIIITYAILPCVLDDVMRDLKDPLILKKLEDKGITVIELPQKEEDIEGKEEDNAIEQLLREAKDIEFTTAAEKSVPDYDAAPNEEVNKLIEAIQDNSIANVTSLLKNGADPNVSEFPDGGPSALFVATKEDNIDIVELLLENGADPNLGCNTFHGTALHYASETNNADMVNLLLTKGKADVNAVDKWNRSPLFNAVDSGSIKAVRSLLKAEAKTDVVNERNRTPLFNAVESGSVEAVKILIENGAKTDVVDEDGQTLLHCAGELQMLKYLIYWGVDVDASDKDSRTPLFNAVESGNIEAVKFLIDIGASIGVVDKDGQTLLHCAGELEMLKYLIFRGVNVNALDKDNRTPLFNAVESGSVEAVEFLIDYGAAKIDVVDKYDNSSLLHCASETGNADIIKLLITKGKADVNAVDKYNRTPLFNAVESGSIEAIDILLTNGASTDVEDKLGNTLLKFAAEAGRTHVVELLYPEGHAKMAAASEKFGIDPSGLVIGKEEKKITKKQKDSVTKGMLQKSSDLALSPESVKSSLRIPRFRKPPKESSVGSGQSKLVKT